MDKYYRNVIVLDLLSVAAGLGLARLFGPRFNWGHYTILLALTNLFFVLAYRFLSRRMQRPTFGRTFMVFSIAKLLFFAIILLTLVLTCRENIIFLLVSLLLFYTLFSICEVRTITSRIKAKNAMARPTKNNSNDV